MFAGGWTIEAAENVCSGESVERSEVLDLLTSLADKSLFVAETRGGLTRYGMLETVRHYAHDQLRDGDDPAAVRARHLDYFVDLADKLGDRKPMTNARQS